MKPRAVPVLWCRIVGSFYILFSFVPLWGLFPTGFRPQGGFACIYTFPINIMLTELARRHISWRTRAIEKLRCSTPSLVSGARLIFANSAGVLLGRLLWHAWIIKESREVFEVKHWWVVPCISEPVGMFSPHFLIFLNNRILVQCRSWLSRSYAYTTVSSPSLCWRKSSWPF